MALTVWESTEYWVTGQAPKPLGSAHRLAAPYQALRASDGWFTVGANNDKLFEAFCRGASARPDLAADPRFAAARDRMRHRTALIAGDRADDGQPSRAPTGWRGSTQAGVPAGPINDYAEALADPHTLARDMVVDLVHPGAGPIKALGVPVKLSDTPGAVDRAGAAARPGQRRHPDRARLHRGRAARSRRPRASSSHSEEDRPDAHTPRIRHRRRRACSPPRRLPAAAVAQAKYPTKTIEVVVPFAPGGGTDNLMRTIVGIIDENKWSPVPINVNNRAGGSGAIGYTYLIGKKGDPHVVAGAHADHRVGQDRGAPARQPPRHDDADDRGHRRADALGAQRSRKYQTIEDFVKAAKERPGPAHRRRHRHQLRGPHLHVPARAGGRHQGEVRAVQLGRRVHDRADGRPRGRRRDEPQRDRRPGGGQEGPQPGGRRQEAAGRRARPADLRREGLRVLLGADARRGRHRRHDRPRP